VQQNDTIFHLLSLSAGPSSQTILSQRPKETRSGQTLITQCISLRGNGFGRLFDTGSSYGKSQGRASALKRRRKGGLEGGGVSPGNLHRIYQGFQTEEKPALLHTSTHDSLQEEGRPAHMSYFTIACHIPPFSPPPLQHVHLNTHTHTSDLTHIPSE